MPRPSFAAADPALTARILEHVTRHPGLTSYEIARGLGYESAAGWPRVRPVETALRDMPGVVQVQVMRPSMGRMVTTYWAA